MTRAGHRNYRSGILAPEFLRMIGNSSLVHLTASKANNEKQAKSPNSTLVSMVKV
jgi:hypothetical protein